MATWAILHFPDENGNAIAPSSWLQEKNTICQWPQWKNTNRLMNAIKTRQSPEQSWSKFPCRVVGGKHFCKLFVNKLYCAYKLTRGKKIRISSNSVVVVALFLFKMKFLLLMHGLERGDMMCM